MVFGQNYNKYSWGINWLHISRSWKMEKDERASTKKTELINESANQSPALVTRAYSVWFVCEDLLFTIN